MKNGFKTIAKKMIRPAVTGMIVIASGLSLGGCLSWSYGSADGFFSTSEIVSDKISVDEFDTLDIHVSSYDVMLKRGDDFGVEYKAEKGSEPRIVQEGGKLTVTQPANISLRISFGSGIDEPLYTITVPDDRSIALTAASSSGNIMTDHVNVSGKIEASSGDILITDTEGGQLEVSTSSGDIGTDKIANEKSTFSSSSGDIEILRLSSDDVSFDTSSGKINIGNSEIGKVVCNASSGDINITDTQAGNAVCNTSSGEVEMKLRGNADDYSYDLNSTSGTITVNDTEKEKSYTGGGNKDRTILVTTTSGDIEISVK